MLKTLPAFKLKTYVGYTNNLKLRLSKHNSNKGAKSTMGYKWKIIYKKKKFFLNLKQCLMNIYLKMIEKKDYPY